jgi:hypothetical protein
MEMGISTQWDLSSNTIHHDALTVFIAVFSDAA